MKFRIYLIVILVTPIIAFAESGAERIGFAAAQGAIVGVFIALVGVAVVFIRKGVKEAKKRAAPKVENLKNAALVTTPYYKRVF